MDSNYAAMVTANKSNVVMSGALAMVLGSLMGTCSNVWVKLVHVPLIQLVQCRYLLQWLFSFSALLVRSFVWGAPLRVFGPAGQRHWLVFRGLAYYAFIWLWWGALRLVPVGDANVIIKIEVFVVGLLARFLCGERLTLRWWGCCMLSLLGVVFVVRLPIFFGGTADAIAESAAPTMLGACLNVLAAVAGALVCILVKFAPDAHFMEVQHVADLIAGLMLSPPLLALFGPDAPILTVSVGRAACVTAFFGTCALCLFTLSFQRGAASRVAIVNFVDVPLAYAAQVLLFGTPVQWTALVGSACIIASSLAAASDSHSRSATKSAGVQQAPPAAAQDA